MKNIVVSYTQKRAVAACQEEGCGWQASRWVTTPWRDIKKACRKHVGDNPGHVVFAEFIEPVRYENTGD